jgi:hypothetical protein
VASAWYPHRASFLAPLHVQHTGKGKQESKEQGAHPPAALSSNVIADTTSFSSVRAALGRFAMRALIQVVYKKSAPLSLDTSHPSFITSNRTPA